MEHRLVDDVVVDERGHRARLRDWRTRPDYKLHPVAVSMFERNKELGLGGFIHAVGVNSTCAVCGEYLTWNWTDETLVATTQCPLPDGCGDTVVFLSVPSGRIVIDDDLRDVYSITDEVERELPSLNSSLGVQETMLAFAALGCAHGFVGNTCPSLYRTGDGTYVIGNPAYDEDSEDFETQDVSLGTRLANVCTDLWWYSIADYDDFLARGGDLDHAMREVVEMPSGRYRFTHHTTRADFDRDAAVETIYAHVERIGDVQ